MAKRGTQTKTKHHMVPRSRCAHNASGESRQNLKTVRHKVHDGWHRLFANLTPIEVLDAILKNFVSEEYKVTLDVHATWEGVEYTTKCQGRSFREKPFLALAQQDHAAWVTVFGRNCFAFDAMQAVIQEWAPREYFTYVSIEFEREGEIWSFHQKL